MPRIIYIDIAGQTSTVDARIGATVMESAVQANVPGIVAECGGACSCATCHVYVDERWTSRLTPASKAESAMLDFATDSRANSRLSCQIVVNEALDGLTVHTPREQG
jgi:ferredoxin, 2Fe-2S